MYALKLVCLTFAWLSVVLRFWARAFVARFVALDDLFLLCATGCFTGACACLFSLALAERHHDDWNTQSLMNIELAVFNLNLVTALFLKTSLAVSFMRLLSKRWQRWVIVVVTIIFGICAIGETFVNVFTCGRPGTRVIKEMTHECVGWSQIQTVSYFLAYFYAVTDWVYILLPAAAMWRSSFTTSAKLAISFVTFVGVMSGTAAIVHAAFIGSFEDLEYLSQGNLLVVNTASVELALGIVATSLVGSGSLLEFVTKGSRTPPATGKKHNEATELDDIKAIKLSPIIYPKALEDGVVISETQGIAAAFLVPPFNTPDYTASRTNRDSWNRSSISLGCYTIPEEILPLPSPAASRTSRFSWRLSGKPAAPPPEESLILPTPAVGRTNRFSWSRQSISQASAVGNITLLIDAASDDEDEQLEKNLKVPYCNV